MNNSNLTPIEQRDGNTLMYLRGRLVSLKSQQDRDVMTQLQHKGKEIMDEKMSDCNNDSDEDEKWTILSPASVSAASESGADTISESGEDDEKGGISSMNIADIQIGPSQTISTSARRASSTDKRISRDIEHCGLKCKLCTEEIKGARWICKQCPRWDVCDNCLSATVCHDIHPNHTFIRISNTSDVFPRDSLYPFGLLPQHLETLPPYNESAPGVKCNACDEVIIGPRYECAVLQCRGQAVMFCEDCEALPIPCHPITHPLIKYKLPKYKCIAINYPSTVAKNETNNMTGADVAECLHSGKSRPKPTPPSAMVWMMDEDNIPIPRIAPEYSQKEGGVEVTPIRQIGFLGFSMSAEETKELREARMEAKREKERAKASHFFETNGKPITKLDPMYPKIF